MKIKKFNKINESFNGEDLQYIIDFNHDTGSNAFDWIKYEARGTNIPEYSKCHDLNFLSEKKFKKAYEYKSIGKKLTRLHIKINELEKEIEKLEEAADYIEHEASNELMYNFQEELLKNDANSFYRLFINKISTDISDNPIIHPSIKEKYKDFFPIITNISKYNL